ncbi:MAG: bifunctional precorrin-2 dehydrogenase/sirohydrochlorin ferrochelatase [Candidatus Zixiibacteriota bacterium]
MANKYLPVNISIAAHKCLVVGGGKVALRKIETLIEFGADITVISPECADKIEYYQSRGELKLEKRAYKSPEAADFGIVISATDDEAVNKVVFEDCKKAGNLVNVVDNPPLCNFIFPAYLKRDAMTIAISTDGTAPFLAAHLRVIMENIFPDHWKRIVSLAGSFRKKVLDRWGDNAKERFASLDRFLSADWKSLIKNKNDEQLDEQLEALLEPQPDEEPAEEHPYVPHQEDAGEDGPIMLEFGEDDKK